MHPFLAKRAFRISLASTLLLMSLALVGCSEELMYWPFEPPSKQSEEKSERQANGGFGWDLDRIWEWIWEEIFDPEAPKQNKNAVSTEDNGLHDNRKKVQSYTIENEDYVLSGSEEVKTLDGIKCDLDFDIRYPQVWGLSADIEGVVNQAIRDTAMRQVDLMYLDPPEATKEYLIEWSKGDPKPYTPKETILWSYVQSYVTYNDNSLISIAFDQHYYIGSFYAEYSDLRTIVIDVATGDYYQKIDEIIDVNQRFVDQWLKRADAAKPDSFFLEAQPKEDFLNILSNDEKTIERYATYFFIDDAENIVVSLLYHMGNDKGVARGWMEIPFTAEELAPYRNDSDFWALYDQQKG